MKKNLGVSSTIFKTVIFFQFLRVLEVLEKNNSCLLRGWSQLLKMMIHALKKFLSRKNLRFPIQVKTFWAYSLHVAVKRYGILIEISENIPFVECFSFGEVPKFFAEVKKFESGGMVSSEEKVILSSVENETRQNFELQSKKKSVGGCWVFALKKHDKIYVVKYKARFVAKRFTQNF